MRAVRHRYQRVNNWRSVSSNAFRLFDRSFVRSFIRHVCYRGYLRVRWDVRLRCRPPCQWVDGNVEITPCYWPVALTFEPTELLSNSSINFFFSFSSFCWIHSKHLIQPENDNDFSFQKQVCDYCDPTSSDRKHPAEYAIDGTELWWQSPPLSRGMKYNEVNLTIDFGQVSYFCENPVSRFE